ncbi:glycine oxidase ThiO [Mesorhizobium sp. VK25A]|uniref:D-amino-acid oxidase n=1 Tax=Mesorhizobium vachelliae TaxID=3072309 RepID=A0ABU5A3P4_9HYPH|nr:MULTISPECIES: glycine oxidase ThiO [unclassified Mesorhizobium]MDX8532311.1 glycine oxidase ThiO [Mesorhizobium sp. VK25D]MDX8545385.1 glycine oxidase ThiO [Mesorhizobium sp. VK25A]
MRRVLVKGAGVAGLTVAHELAARGASVTVAEIRSQIGGKASWLAGGMLAPWCERESAEEAVVTLGKTSAEWWDRTLPGVVTRAGTLVVAHARDALELARFATRTRDYEAVDEDAIAALEPDLAGRFRKGMFFAGEAHLDPRRVLEALAGKLRAMGVAFLFEAGEIAPSGFDQVIDCTGIAQAEDDLRGVRGEMLILRTREVSLARPVRLLHPRHPIYIVPRADHHVMVGATMIESDHSGPITARSLMELLNAAYALHPAFGEAEIVETGVGVRPAYPDNLPRVKRRKDGTITVNGLYRHGFLLSPAMAEQAAGLLFNSTTDLESDNEADRQRRSA